jgi:tRNA A37 threonylcarbamoyladenosine modification protein TsaB
VRLLAIDTAADLCAACVFDTQGGERGRAVLDIGKGHAERLMAVIDEALAKAGSTYADLDAIAVAVGSSVEEVAR